jgi:hypothetical protein
MKNKFFRLIAGSFHNLNFYREVAFEWKGTNLLYLLVIVALCWIPPAVRLDSEFSAFVKNNAPEIIRQVPEIKFQDGRAISSQTQPVFIKNSETGEILGLIDTADKADIRDLNRPLMFILKSSAITLQNSYGASRAWQISDLGLDGLTLNQETLREWAEFSSGFFIILVFPFAVFITFVFRMIQIFIYSAMIFVLSGFSGANLKYENTFRIATVAVIPGLVLKALLDGAGLTFNLIEAVMSVITLALGASAVKYIKNQDKTKETEI